MNHLYDILLLDIYNASRYVQVGLLKRPPQRVVCIFSSIINALPEGKRNDDSLPVVIRELCSEVIGEVKLSFFFESMDGRLSNGLTCNPWPIQKCSIFLKICISSSGERTCNIHGHQTEIWENNQMGQVATAFPLRTSFFKIMDVVVEAWNHNLHKSPDLIARYRGSLVIVETPNTATPFHMAREDLRYENKFRLESYAHIVCAPFHYGGDCKRRCIPGNERYACDINGFKKCRPGFLGTECDQRDYCLYHNCSSFAECKNTPTGFECWCEGRFGSQCQHGYKPCAPKHMSCSGHGVCTPAGPYNISFNCDCDIDWEGPRCEIRRPVCAVANASNKIICLNEGKCKDLNVESGAYTCECPSGWWGQHCEKKTLIIYKIVFKSMIYVGIVFVILVIIAPPLIVCCKWRWKNKPHLTSMSSTSFPTHQMQSELEHVSSVSLYIAEPRAIIPASSATLDLPSHSPRFITIPTGNRERYFDVSAFV